jgi:hypothetical protein
MAFLFIDLQVQVSTLEPANAQAWTLERAEEGM